MNQLLVKPVKPAQLVKPPQLGLPLPLLYLLTCSRSTKHNKRLSPLSRCTFPYLFMGPLLHGHPLTHAPIHPSITPSTCMCMHITCCPLKVTSSVGPRGGAEVQYDSTCVHLQRQRQMGETMQIGDATKAASASSYLLALHLPTYPLIHRLLHPPISWMCPSTHPLIFSNNGSQIMVCRMCTHPNAPSILHLQLK